MFLGLFVLGTAEMLVVGVLDLIAEDFGVSVPRAGTLVTAYALGLAIGGPLLTALTIKANKRLVLIGIVVAALVTLLISVVTTSLAFFLAVRAVGGALQGLFLAVAISAGVSIVPKERAGQAISIIVAGASAASALGTPVGTLIGQSFGWRGAFVTLAGLTVLVLLAMLVLVPSVPGTEGDLRGQLKAAFAPRVLAVLGLCLLVFASIFSALTYIVPFLKDVTGVSGGVVSVFLFAYGIANVAGVLGGGRFADKNASATLVVGLACSALTLLALYLLGTRAVLVAVLLLVWSLFAQAVLPSLQVRVMTLAGPGSALAQSLPVSAANIGLALGPITGGLAISRLGGVRETMLMAMAIAVVGVGVAWATSLLKAPAAQDQPPQSEPTPDAEAVK